MDDQISRQAAIDAVRTYYDDEYALADSIEELIEKLPSAQPERNTGEWREHIFDGIMGRRPRALMCTNCNVISMYASNFCPNCGADMREVQDD